MEENPRLLLLDFFVWFFVCSSLSSSSSPSTSSVLNLSSILTVISFFNYLYMI